MSLTVVFLVISMFCNFTREVEFVDNSIGVAQIDEANEDSIKLDIIIPVGYLKNFEVEKPILDIESLEDKVIYEGTLSFFDEIGPLGEYAGIFDFEIKFWCENDGGIQFRPNVVTSIPRSIFDREVVGNPNIENIACCVILNRDPEYTYRPIDINSVYGTPIQKFDLDSNGQPDVLIAIVEDESGICTKSVRLLVGSKRFYLNCCGP